MKLLASFNQVTSVLRKYDSKKIIMPLLDIDKLTEIIQSLRTFSSDEIELFNALNFSFNYKCCNEDYTKVEEDLVNIPGLNHKHCCGSQLIRISRNRVRNEKKY